MPAHEKLPLAYQLHMRHPAGISPGRSSRSIATWPARVSHPLSMPAPPPFSRFRKPYARRRKNLQVPPPGHIQWPGEGYEGRLAAWGCLAALGLLLARSAEAAQAVRDGLALCAGSVIPALFPFLAVSGLLTALDAGASPALGPLARLLGCSRAGAQAFLLGLTGSYPVGARTVAQLYRRGGISPAGGLPPAAVFQQLRPGVYPGGGRAGLLRQPRAGAAVGSAYSGGAGHSPGPAPAGGGAAGTSRLCRPVPPLVPALIAAVRDAAGTMVYICGFVVFFLVLLRVMGRVTGLSHPVLSGAVELTQGILALPLTRRGFVWAAGLLGWGGLSVHGQSAAVLSGTDLPMGPYLAAKATHAAVSVLLAWPVSMCL